jgi:hypothetical protein
MINFRYHIVSLMAVFLALAVGIAAGVSLGTPLDQGLLQQAAQDRKQVTDLRAEIGRRDALDRYRETYDQAAGAVVTDNLLAGTRVAIVAMPDAPPAVAQAINTAVTAANGEVVREVRVSDDVFDPTRADQISKALGNLPGIQLSDKMSAATKVGTALGRAIADPSVGDRDQEAQAIGRALTGAGLASLSGGSPAQAQLVIVVTAEATDPAPDPEVPAAHLELDMALKERAAMVIAGPNSTDINGTDVLAARSNGLAADSISTVDVADLASGVTTTVLAGKERLLGRPARQYGAMDKAEAALPALPVR